MRAFLVPVLLLIAWLAGTPAAQAHELPCPPGAMKTVMPVGHGHYPIAPVTADAETDGLMV
jgi:hypothetical protein